MRKITILVALIFISAISFAQVKKQKASGLKAVHVEKHINNMTNSAKVIVDSLHYDGDNADAVGAGAATYTAAAFFPAAILTPHNAVGNTITSVSVYVNEIDSLTSSTLKFYSDQTTVVYSQAFTAVLGWQNVVLTTPLPIPTTDLYIGYEVVCTGGFACGTDAADPANVNGNWILFNGTWDHLSTYGITGNWNIRAMIDGTVLTTPVALIDPASWAAGDVVVGNSSTSPTIALQNVGGGTLTVSGITGLSAPYTTTLVPATVSLTAGQSATFSFTYAPTAAGAANQTVTIATNGGNVTFDLTGNGVQCSTISTFPWSESFEGASFPPACWTKASPDGGTGWAIVADGTTPVPGFNGGTMTVPTGGGTKAAYATYTTGGAASNDQWLISPKIAVPAGKALSFQLFRFGAYQDYIDVKVSTTDDQTASFTTNLIQLDTTLLPSGVWVAAGASLSAFAGQNIYIAFNEHIADNQVDGAFYAIDLVTIDINNGVVENAQDVVSIFPNPANNRLYIAANRIQSVEVYNLTGAKVASYGNQNSINISDLAQGTYLVRVISESKVTTQKINIVR